MVIETAETVTKAARTLDMGASPAETTAGLELPLLEPVLDVVVPLPPQAARKAAWAKTSGNAMCTSTPAPGNPLCITAGFFRRGRGWKRRHHPDCKHAPCHRG